MAYYYRPLSGPKKNQEIVSDICIYGATSSGVLAAVQAASMGKKVALVAFDGHVGGMTTSGLSATDIGNRTIIGGLTRQFHRALRKYYGADEHWYFEPHLASAIFSDWIKEHNIDLYLEHPLMHVEKNLDNRITRIVTENGVSFKATVYIDATYEGDLLARAGVSYTIGREPSALYDEHYNGVYYGSAHHNFVRFVDPYRKPGNKHSGLLPGISPIPPETNGEGDRLIQAYNFRLCLTKDKDKYSPFPKPREYDLERYELLHRYIEAGIFDIFDLTLALPNGKFDYNNWGAVNSDNIGANYDWPEGNYLTREEIYQDHVNYQQGLLWFLAHDERLPEKVRQISTSYGLAADEFQDTDNWPPQLYVREARRMISDYILTEHNTLGRYQVDDPVGMASYKMDSHNCKRIVKSGRAMNEGNVEAGPVFPYGIPYRAIRPKKAECLNLIVPVCVSASHIAYGSIRIESIYMILGQSAGMAAALAIDKTHGVVQDLSYSDLEKKLMEEKQILSEQSGSTTSTEILARELQHY